MKKLFQHFFYYILIVTICIADIYAGKLYSFKVLLFVPLYFYILYHIKSTKPALVFAFFVSSAWTAIDCVSNYEFLDIYSVINFMIRLGALVLLSVLILKYKIQKEQLRETSEKLKVEINEKNAYLGMAAHDLRTPINNIFSFTELLIGNDNFNLNDNQKRHIENIRKMSGKMILLLRDTLDFSKVESGTLKLNKLAYEYITTINEIIDKNREFAIKKGLKILFYHEGEKLMVNIDRIRIEQVIENLLTNAIKYSKPNTVILIKVFCKENFFVTQIEDQGVGINEREIEHVFKPFVKSSSKPTAGEESTGLGLAISKKIIEVHSGSIEIISKVNVGTTVRFTLPL